MPIFIFLFSHWFLSLFSQTFFLHRYGAHRMFTLSRPAERMFYFLTFITQGASFLVPRAYAILHRMHHADLEFDVTTGMRFHPVEILLSMVIKLGMVLALGAPALAVLIFEVLLNATSMFNHGNVLLPQPIDRVLRTIVVTPEMHRVHHSIEPPETNSNFGFNLPWWDRLFGTYRAQPAAGHAGMTIGLDLFRNIEDLRLDRMLFQPLIDSAGRYPINRRDC